MKALYIHYGHNATCLFSRMGEVLYLGSEERITRLKNCTGFPHSTVRLISDSYLGGTGLRTLDALYIIDGTMQGALYNRENGWEPVKYQGDPVRRRGSLFGAYAALIPVIAPLFSAKRFLARFILGPLARRELRVLIKKKYGYEGKIVFLDHHACHAWSTFAFESSPDFFSKPVLAFTSDGEGDDLSATVSIFHNNVQRVLLRCDAGVSLGKLYATVTALLGFKPYEHEFKLMGMAPYADLDSAAELAKLFRGLITIDPNTGDFKGVNFRTYSIALEKILRFKRFDQICGAIQLFTEQILLEWIEYWIKRTGIDEITLSGGVFMNVKAVKSINSSTSVRSTFVCPSAGDESLPIGAWAYSNAKMGGSVTKIGSLYLGRMALNDQDALILALVTDGTLEYEVFDDYIGVNSAVVDLLKNQKVVARCVGREEWGARALGNRSIIASPDRFDTVKLINKSIKARDFWMPFSPSVLAECAGDYLEIEKSICCNYMATTVDLAAQEVTKFGAVCHPQDLTVRPQVVSRRDNEQYHNLIEQFYKKTGLPAILNTSFNLHGEPNVGVASDAISTLKRSGLEYLQIENVLIWKSRVAQPQ